MRLFKAITIGLAFLAIPVISVLVIRYSYNVLYTMAAGVVIFATLVKPRLGLYLMLVLTPLQNLLITGSGATLVRWVGILVFVAWVMHKIATRGSLRSFLSRPIVLPMVVFFSLCLVSVLWTNLGFWQDNMFTYLQLGVWVLILIDLVDSYANLDKALFWVFVGAMIGASLAVSDFFTQTEAYNPRGKGGFNDPNYSSAIFMFVLPFVFHRIRYSHGWQRLAWLASVIVLLSGVAFTVSRTGLLAIALLLAGQFFMLSKTKTRVRYILLLVILTLIIIPLWPWGNITYRFAQVWSGGGDQDLGQRVGGLRYGWELFLSHPLIGQGLSYLPGQDVIHNVFLGLAVKLGIFGFLAMVWLWLTTWRSLARALTLALDGGMAKTAELISALQLSAVIYLFFSLSLATETSRPLWFLFALGSICIGVVQNARAAQAVSNQKALVEKLPGFVKALVGGDGD